MYDVIIIGAGVSGAACARELSQYQGRMCVLEKQEDVCCGTSKANSGIIHAGYDAAPNSLMAKLNVQGNQMMPQLAEDLDISFVKTGSFVVAIREEMIETLEELYLRGIANGVKGLEIIRDKNRIKEMEPNLVDEVVAVLYAPTAGIVCPFELNIAMAENAYDNGVEFQFHTEVIDIQKIENGWEIKAKQGKQLLSYRTKFVVNAAGVHADYIHNMVSKHKINITARRGEYLLLDKLVGNHVQRPIFALPTAYGKGILVTPSVHGNLLIGPTATDVSDKEDNTMSREGIYQIIEKAMDNVKEIPMHQVITSFAGNRAHEDGHEFLIKELEDGKGFIDCAGIESPGLTSSPAIGVLVSQMIKEALGLIAKEHVQRTRKGIVKLDRLTKEEKIDFIRDNPNYGTIICRCEMISEGEILDAIHRPLGARTLDGIKRRVRATAGRCQGGFCTPKLIEILHRECHIPMEEILKSGKDSHMLVGKNKNL